MEFRVLGPLEAVADGRSVPLGSRKLRALLALLVLNHGEVVSRDRLIEELWHGAPPPAAATTLRSHVSRLRTVVGSEHLQTRPPGYLLAVEGDDLDLVRFEVLVASGRRKLTGGHPHVAVELIERALRLWRGPALADLADEPFAQAEIPRLEELRLSAREELFDAKLATGRHAELAGELDALVAENPLRERLRAQYMLALYRSGRQSDALDVYREGRRLLTDELGLEPGTSLQALQKAILAHDPELDGAPVRATPQVETRDELVGREGEQAELAAGLDEVLAGTGRLFLVSGEPGIGKSRLAEQFAAHARARGALVLAGRCWEAGGAPAYWPWVQALRAHVGAEDPATIRRQAGQGISDLAQILPELSELVGDVPAVLSTDPEVARFRLFDAVAMFLRSVAEGPGLVLVLDDLHAADTPSLVLLRFLTRTLRESRLLVVAAYRDVDPTMKDPLSATIADVSREPVTRRISLGGLQQEEVATLVAQTTDVEPPRDVAAAIYQATEGNPFFVGEIARLLVSEGALAESATALAWEGRVPEGVRAVILRRLQQLSRDSVEMLVVASILGREFDLEALEGASGRDRDSTLELLDEAARERVVADAPGAAGRRRFAHALIRDTLYDGLPSGRRAQLERTVGEALERLYAGDVEPHLAELAHHFLLAVPATAPTKAIDYARRAGDRAVELTAFEEAGRLYEMALRTASDDVVRCELLIALGDAQTRAGDTPASKETFLEAAGLAEVLRLPRQLARAALGYGGRIVWDVQRDDQYLKPLLEKAALGLGDEDDELQVRLLSRLAAGPLRDASYAPERRHELSDQALAMARRLDDPSTLAYALAASIAAYCSPPRTEQQVSDSTELIEIATRAGEPERAVEAYDHRASALLELGDIDGAEADVLEMARLTEKLRQPSQMFYVAEVRAGLALLRGQLEEAEELIHSTFELGRQVLEWNASFTYAIQLYFLRRHQGRLHGLAEMFESDENAKRYETYPIWDCLVMRFHDELGHQTRAREQFELFAEADFTRLTFDEEWLVSMGLLAEEAAALEDGERARILYELLVPYADRVATSYSEACTGSVSRYLGLLAATSSRVDMAKRHFEDAIVVNERIGARPWLAQTQEDYARMLLAGATQADASPALSLLDRAESTYLDLGMGSHASRVSAQRTQAETQAAG
jgi:DNA-binding SARP family transcriptional activator/tetratricopeptide (TPR) repeat protein